MQQARDAPVPAFDIAFSEPLPGAAPLPPNPGCMKRILSIITLIWWERLQGLDNIGTELQCFFILAQTPQ